MRELPPRLELARLPTPIDHLPDLSRELGIELFVKRDDMTGSALGGNKIRKLEFELARALDEDADVVLTCGAAQSNHCRATAIAARSAGLEVELFLRGAEHAPLVGNFFLDLLVGAGVHDLSPREWADKDAIMQQRKAEIEAKGRTASIIVEGASSPLGSLGYVRCMQEILDEERESTMPFDAIITAVGSGGTLAGLLMGARVLGFEGQVLGVPVWHDAAHFQARVETILRGMRDAYFPGADASCPIETFVEGHVGLGYGQATPEELQRLRDFAVLTGIILDPVYTNKALGGLLALIKEGAIEEDARVLFLHTGGLFGVMPYADQFQDLRSTSA